ncbi:trypsin-like peptidase domain-containing protein [Roseomonas sp. SSH11]|uniref:Trypsin-like peptidase domain-containing protein n=1 Tax=Pararoseomonas baculiformis TaxID=2820812 RepID=A0ABS4AEC8_9PROT|nr:trypsin-like peptidase domain-containing protein [Pararoseomonas baculiformis]MBP0444594.1 trypsin-like peptidase domain-containing protein [Pararoseomonas baculiformis]
MRALLLSSALLLSVPALAQAPAPADPPTATAAEAGFRVINRTGQAANALHAVRSGRPDWGGNLLPRPLPNNAGYRLRSNPQAGCRFDLRLVLEDGREAVSRNEDICAQRDVTLDGTNLAPAGAVVRPSPEQPTAPQAIPRPGVRASTGTGFLVAGERVLTNRHVVDGCDRVLVRGPDGRNHAAVPPARTDARLDLALLAVPGLSGPVLSFRQDPPLRRGEGVVAYGYPLSGLLSSDAKLTRGEVNGLAGLRDNPDQIQISAPVQPGNSGGPLLDMQGNVVGVVVSKLNAQAVAGRTGDIAQNINFAVRGERAAAFLRAAGVAPATARSTGADRSAADVGEIAERATVFIRCER